ncbi:uncharacterized protein TNCV_3696591 [Trichonephila clavipes]|uniref:Mutator-like transposase domain-containing protein n=1 Tax=Trichonephila clavipes TaxID=2585209 RepID=A0A8X6V987_TRICX|nr:uncharacterized protein TNCV_3696591 [Trichonephila clavipes]
MAKSRSGRSKKRRFTEIVIPFVPQLMRMMKHLSSILLNPLVPKSWNQARQVWKFSQKDCLKLLKTIELFPYDREDERFLSYKLFNCFAAKDNRERIFSWQKNYVLSSVYLSCQNLLSAIKKEKLLKATERVAQENINAALSEIKGSNSFTKCGISIDGTWQRRGYSSLNGCVSAISVDTGKILDIEVMTQYCHICAKGNSQSSKHVCSNYKGSAGNMEVVEPTVYLRDQM